MAQLIEIKKIEDGKVFLRYGDLEWDAEVGDAIRIGTPAIAVHRIGEDKDTGKRYVGPIALPRRLSDDK